MADSNFYKQNNYFLKEMADMATFLHTLKTNDGFLFLKLNELTTETLESIKERYIGNVGPVNSLRKELAESLLEGNTVTLELIDLRSKEIEEESGKRSFNAYNYFSILFPFFQSSFELDFKEALTELASQIASNLNITSFIKVHAVDFWGSRGFGEDRAWTAIYNETHLNHQTAKQLFVNVTKDGVFCGLFDRMNQYFIGSTQIEVIDDKVLTKMIDFFKPFVDEVKEDQYSQASFQPIGVKGAKFYKLSHGKTFFTQEEIQNCIDANIAVMHNDTSSKGGTFTSQFELFEKAKKGDFFYNCWGNNQFLLIGQFIDDEVRDFSLNVNSEGWKERSYRIIQQVQLEESYRGSKKEWAPNDPSTFVKVPETDYNLINQIILRPYFQAEIIADKLADIPEDRIGVSSQRDIKVLDDRVSPKLDVKIVAREFAHIIDNLEDNKGQMLGVFGSWGRGKTFLVDHVKDELEPKEGEKESYINVTFNAWKYQETEAIWAYLYELILDTYVLDGVKPKSSGFKKKIVSRKRTFMLNFKRKGYSKFVGIFLSFIASLIITYVVSSSIKRDLANYLISAVGIIGLIQAYILYRKYYQGIKDVLNDYSSKNNYRSVLGLQAEIQDELIVLVKHWLRDDDRRIVLFVDDLDRCNEDRIIHIIDALRVMLDDDYLVKKLIIIVAIDELLLKRAIQLKYQDFEIGKEEKNLVQEYLDKLFIAGIKFPSLNVEEQAIILENYAGKGDMLEVESKSSGETTDNKSFIPSVEGISEFAFPEPSAVHSKIVESEFFLLRYELELLQKYSNEISYNVTPRGLRIYMYRYLLSKNLASAYMSGNARYQLSDEVCELLARAIANKSSNEHFSVDEMEEVKNIDNSRLKEFVPKLVDMVVPY